MSQARSPVLSFSSLLLWVCGLIACGADESSQATVDGGEFDASTQSDASVVAHTADSSTPDDAGIDAEASDGRSDSCTPSPLRVMTFNIQTGRSGTLEEMASLIRAQAPDMVGLQEVDVGAERSKRVDQVTELAERVGLTGHFSPSFEHRSGGEYGLALLSRYPVVDFNPVLLPSVGEQRQLALFEVDTPCARTWVGVTHLGLLGFEREDQAQVIVQQMRGYARGIVMGDLNATPGASEIKILRGGFEDAFELGAEPGDRGYTFPALLPIRRIDYILTSPETWRVSGAHVVDERASDHLAVVVELSPM